MNRKDLIVGLLLGVTLMFVIYAAVLRGDKSGAVSYYENNIKAQEEKVTNVAKLLGRGAATSQIEFVVPECPLDQMVAYDTLLAALDKGLTRAQLVELDTLFNHCGDVAANRRSGTALQLEYEVALLRSYIDGRSFVTLSEVDNTNIAKWETLAKKEIEIASLFVKLVQSQDAIITTLLTGVSPTSINVENIRATAQKLREDLNVLVGEAATLRAELIK